MKYTQSFSGQGAMCSIVFHVDDPVFEVAGHALPDDLPTYGTALQWQHPSISSDETGGA